MRFHPPNFCFDKLFETLLYRKFVLKPWAEIAPDYIIKGQTLSIKELYKTYLGNRFKNQMVNIIDN